MEKVSLPFFYQVGSGLGPLSRLVPDRASRLDILVAIFTVRPTLDTLLNSFPALTVCRGVAGELQNLMTSVVELPVKEEEWSKPLEAFTPYRTVITKAKEFEIVLTAELQGLPSYLPDQKGIYDTTLLIDQADRVLPASALAKLRPPVREELRQSGRCLAFDIGTACGFHMMRAVELVLHDYYLSVCKPNPRPRGRLNSWGAYMTKLRPIQQDDVKEVVAIIQQLKDRHRNRLMHPEIVLGPDEAFTLFEVGQSAIIAMSQRL